MPLVQSLRIVHLLSSPLWSGAMPHLFRLAEKQAQNGHRVQIYKETLRSHMSGGFEEAAPADHPLFASSPTLRMSAKSGVIGIARDIFALRSLRDQVDIVHCHCSHSQALASFAFPAQIPVVRTLHKYPASMHRLRRWALARGRALIVRHPEQKTALARYPALSRHTIHAIWPSADQNFRPAQSRHAAREHYALPQQSPLLLCCSHLDHRGQEEWVDLFAKTYHSHASLSDAHLVFAGDGPARQALAERVRHLGLVDRVHFLGHISYRDLPNVYAAANVILLGKPSNDSMQRGVFEALLCGRPVIWHPLWNSWLKSIAQSMPEMLLALPDWSPSSLASAMGHAANAPESFELPEQFSIEAEERETMKVYRSLLD